jgi:uncharacterized SAM-binding protein YcdF (DUF218 family)
MGLKYYLTKIVYSFILLPGNIIVLFFIAAFLAKRFKKVLLFFAILFYMLTTQYAGNLLLSPLESPYNHPPKAEKVDAVVVLGAGHYAGSSNLPLTPTATKRLLYGLMLAKKENYTVLFSGAGAEADVARKTILELNRTLDLGIGVASDDTYRSGFHIYFEHNAKNTQQNAQLTKVFFEKNGIDNPKIYLVTSAAHMKRAEFLFRQAGIEVIPAATDFRTNKEFCYCFFFPSSEGLDLCSRAILEYLAYFKDSR